MFSVLRNSRNAVLPHVTTPQPTEGWQAGGKEGAWGPVSTDAQMGKQVNINKETRETLPVLSCFCLCKEEEMFVKPISQNGLPLTAGGPAKPPLHPSCIHRALLPVHKQCRVTSGEIHFAEYSSIQLAIRDGQILEAAKPSLCQH